MTKNTSEYQAYHDAKNRCTNTNNPWYPFYGGSGIKFLLNSFSEFINSLGTKPTKKHSLDRIDPKGHYELSNLRWATKSQQSYNQRRSCDNKSGITGVELKKQRFWYASGRSNKKYTHLYCGDDFFLACCARKSWEGTLS